MAKAEILLPDDPTYARDAKKLVEAAKSISASYSRLVSDMIAFAEQFRAISERAKAMDSADDGQRYDDLCDALTRAVKSANPSVWSRWNTIASQAKQLRRYSQALPPYRDSLYEVALTLNDKPAEVERWVKQSELTPDTPHSKIKSLRTGKKNTAKGKVARSAAKGGYPAAVTLFFADYEAAFEFICAAMAEDSGFQIGVEKALDAKFQALGEAEYAKAKKRFA